MITPTEIKEQCLKWWNAVLIAVFNGQDFFPKEISRIGKVQTKDILDNILDYRQAIDQLKKQSKEQKNYGYTISWEERNFNKIGRNPVPGKITFNTVEDYLKFTNKEKEYHSFLEQATLISQTIPQLQGWIVQNSIKVIEHRQWPDTLKVCAYFLQNPQPNLYIRQLPIAVHTKFIKEENEALFRSLLEYLIPEYIQLNETRFEKRFNLKYAEPLIRIRFLDKSLSPLAGVSDISIPISEFRNYYCSCRNIFVTENLMNFLTLPDLPNTIALWSGGGFNVSYLQDISWLTTKQVYYWGDIDAHGFQILHQFRTYFPNTQAVMMNQETLTAFIKETGTGVAAKIHQLSTLTAAERELYTYITPTCIRLEQEKITQDYAENAIKEFFKSDSDLEIMDNALKMIR
jgi:hypothetical protein